MKNNKVQILLIIVVAFIWYKAFGRIWGNLNTDNALVDLESDEVAFVDVKRDSFSLSLNYDDPFVVNAYDSKVSMPTDPEFKAPSIPIANKHSVEWPIIEYRGLVLKQGSNSPLVILKVDQQDVIMRLGEKTFGGVHLIHANREFIELKFQDSKRKFWRD